MSNWKEKRFDSFIKLNRGFDLPNDKIVQGSYPVVASTNIKGYHNEFKIKAPVVVTGRSGSLGKVQYIDKDCTPLNTTLYVKDYKDNNPKFVYYYLQIMHLEIFNSGAGVPTLNQNHLHSLKVKIPDLKTQEKIADILSSYDDLIENNNRRIAILEQTAQELYKEWFVRFRFPGHEKASFENGIPKGWEVKRIGELVEVGRGASPRPITNDKFFENGIIPWVKIADATASNIFIFQTKNYINEYGASFSRKLEAGSLILAASGTLGFPIFLDVSGCIHDGWIYFYNYTGITKEYLYYILMDLQRQFNNVSYGAAIQNINTSIVRNAKVLIPNNDILNLFQDRIIELHSVMRNYLLSNQNLIKQRDLLVPRLMSGKLEV